MRIAALLCCLLSSYAASQAAIIPATPAVVRPVGGMKVYIQASGNFQGDEMIRFARFQSDVQFTGVLDTDASTVTFDELQWTVEADQRSRVLTFDTFIPPTPPMCDANGCTPGTPGMEGTEQFVITISFNEFTFRMDELTRNINMFEPSIATLSRFPRTMLHTPEITGHWTIQGPTEMKSGDFTVGSHWNGDPIQNHINLTREPAEFGPITEWSPRVSDIHGLGSPGLMAVDIVVDGQTFRLLSEIPEPTTLVSGFICIACCGMLARRHGNQGSE